MFFLKKLIKSFCRIFVVILILFFILVGTFFVDSGRKILLAGITKYFQVQNTIFVIKGLDYKITKIEEIFIKTPDGIELIFSNVSLRRPQLKFSFSTKFLLNAVRFHRSSIYVDKFVLNGAEEEIDLNEKLKNLIPLMRILRIFIADLSLGKGELNILRETYTLDGLRYKSKINKDYLYSKIDNYYVLDVLYKWQGFECTESEIKFEKFIDFDGVLHVKNPEKENSEYKFYAANKNVKIESDGTYKDFMLDILIQNALVEYQDKSYKLAGNLYLKSKKVYLTTKLDLTHFVRDLPLEIKQNFENVVSVLDINYNFAVNEKSTIDIKFVRSAKNIGDIKCSLQNNAIDAYGNINWIKIYGFQPQKIFCKSNTLEDFNIVIEGDGFEAITDINASKINKEISVQAFKFGSESCGFLQLSKPCVLNKDSDYHFTFKFDCLDFWNKFIPISGDAAGTIFYKKGNIVSKFNSKNLHFENHSFYDCLCHVNGRGVDVSVKQASVFCSKHQNLYFKIDDEKIKITSTLNDDLLLDAAGKISALYKKISFENFSINSPEYVLKTKIFDVDLEKDNYKILCDLLNKKSNKKGVADITKIKTEIDIKLDSFQTNIVSKIFNRWVPNCNLNGKVQLKLFGNVFIGDGSFKIYGLVSRANTMDVSLKLMNTGMYFDVILKNHSDLFKGNLFAPIYITNNGTVIKNLHAPSLNCRIYGNTHIENLLELSDKIDARGLLNCDVKISGSFASPIISGSAEMQKAYFIINDIFLRNGTISLFCEKNKILVSRAEFIDIQKKKLNISGSGVFYFNHITPSIKTKLQLKFDNFMLFDSDDMKISISGNGDITGSITDLLIRGDVDVTKCKIQKLGSEDVEKSNDIIIENERNVEKQSLKENREADFCKYDVNMRCPKIDIVGSIFEMILSGNLKLLSYDNKATLVGSLKLRDGKLDLFGKRLKFTKGNVEFIEKYPFDPISYFKCNRNLGEMIVYLEITNHPETGVDFDLYSSPDYTHDVILANMLFGKELKYLSVTEAAQLANAVASFKRKGYIFSILNTFQKIGLIDTLSFAGSERKSNSLYSDEQSLAEQNTLNVSAGKYIHDNIYISVNKKSDNITTFDVDLSLTPKMSIKANSSGEAGISWKYRY